MSVMWALGIHVLHLQQLLSPLTLRSDPFRLCTPPASELLLPRLGNPPFLGCF